MLPFLDYVTLPARYNELRQQVRAFVIQETANISVVDRARSWQGFDGDFSKKLADKGWVGLTLPKDYGGADLDPFARFVVVEELLCSGAPVAAHWISDRQSGPLILRYGSEQQKQHYLPRICRGEAFFCIGMSEPGSGSDLASVRSHAEKKAEGWILNGQKIWTTWAQKAHNMIALVRTSGTKEDRHKGLSQFLIPMDAPGITIRPIRDLVGGEHFCEVFFDNVRLPADSLLGEEGDGWKQVTSELAFERSGPERIYSSIILLNLWLDWAQKQNQPQFNVLAGRLISHLFVLRNLSLALTAQMAEDKSPVIEAALVKDLGTEFEQSLPALLTATLDVAEDTGIPAPLGETLVYLTCIAPAFSLRGGTREILRGVIARGLGLR